MVRHVIIWSFKEEFSAAEKSEFAVKIKEGIEGLMGKIDGLTHAEVNISPLPSSSGELMLDTTFTDVAALEAYQKNPDHLAVANFVRSVVGERRSFDFEV